MDQSRKAGSEFSVIIPTLNAAKTLPLLLKNLKQQTLTPLEVLLVDSSSEDETLPLAREAGLRTLSLARKDFDHGGTRDWALRQSDGEYIVFLTQDAILSSPDSLEKLLLPMVKDSRIAAVGGRQLPKADAAAYERLVRSFNYPEKSRVWSQKDIAELGIRAFLISDVFAAYRRSAYLEVGGFDHPIMTNEDMLMAQKLLSAGYRLAYSGEACVLHSHNLSWKQQYRRNYIVGQTMVRYADRFSHVEEMGEGVSLFKNVTGALLKEKRYGAILGFGLDCSARLLGNRLGRRKEAGRKP